MLKDLVPPWSLGDGLYEGVGVVGSIDWSGLGLEAVGHRIGS